MFIETCLILIIIILVAIFFAVLVERTEYEEHDDIYDQ